MDELKDGKETQKQVVIVGGGLAGLGAAERLLEKGITNFVILEARNRLGGRVMSVEMGKMVAKMEGEVKKEVVDKGEMVVEMEKVVLEKEGKGVEKRKVGVREGGAVGKGGVVVEMGAQWIHGVEGNPLYTIAKQHNLLRKQKDRPLSSWLAKPDDEGDDKHNKYCDNEGNENVDEKNIDNNDWKNVNNMNTNNNEDGNEDCYIEGNNFMLSDGTRISGVMVKEVFRHFNKHMSDAALVFKNKIWKRSRIKKSLHEMIQNENYIPLLELQKYRLDGVEDISMSNFIKREFKKVFEAQRKTSISGEAKKQLDRDLVVQEALLEWRIRTENIENACDNFNEIPMSVWGEYDLCEGEEESELEGRGFGGLIDVLVGRIAENCGCRRDIKLGSYCEHVRVGCVVEEIEWNGGKCYCEICKDGKAFDNRNGNVENNNENSKSGVVVRVRGGGFVRADHVIVTLPLGVLKEKASGKYIEKLGGRDAGKMDGGENGKVCREKNNFEDYNEMFLPSLPPCKINCIQNLSFGTVNKIFLKLEEPLWGEGVLKSIQLVWNEGEIVELECLKKRGRSFEDTTWLKGIQGFDCHDENTICGWVGGKEAVDMEKEDNEMVGEVCVELLSKFIGGKKIPRLLNTLKSAWYSDEFSRGSYSFRGFKSSYLDSLILSQPLPSPQSPTLLFAGEACHPTFYSTAHGAYLSGGQQAQQLIDFLNTS